MKTYNIVFPNIMLPENKEWAFGNITNDTSMDEDDKFLGALYAVRDYVDTLGGHWPIPRTMELESEESEEFTVDAQLVNAETIVFNIHVNTDRKKFDESIQAAMDALSKLKSA